MSIVNGYATLAEVLSNKSIKSTDVADDAFIEAMIENTSRLIDEVTGRWFYPKIQTRLHDTPALYELRLDADLLEATTVTNGDTTTVTAAEYTTMPLNDSPIWALRLKPSASISWSASTAGDYAGAVSVAGIWGYHTSYRLAWRLLTTISAAIATTTVTTFTATAGTQFSSGQIVKVDSEFMLVTGVSGVTITVERGWNGSTAATHLISAAVYVFRWQGEINRACRDIVISAYNNLFGNNATGQISITGAGVIITPDDIPATTRLVLEQIQRKGW
jgi:hypothetical protein